MSIFNNKIFWLVLVISCILIFGMYLNYNMVVYYLIFVLLIISILALVYYPQIGIYLMAILYPFVYFQFVYGKINIPYIDLLAIALFVSWVIKYIYQIIKKQEKFSFKIFPGLFLMILFIVSAVLSLGNIESEYLTSSIKYIFRPLMFFYLMYVILPFNLIDNFKKLFNVFRIMFVLGLSLSFMGVWSLIFPPIVGIRRALPISIFGVYPLGINHNALAEVLVCLVPIALILFWHEKDVLIKNVYLLGAFLMASMILLSLSRSGWLALAVEILILVIVKYRHKIKSFPSSYLFYLFILFFTPFIFIMYKFLNTSTVFASNSNRLKMIEISLNLFQEQPLVGKGVGMFYHYVSSIQWFIIEYGSALDAHGFIWKTLAEMGIFGFLSFSFLLSYVVVVLFSSYLKSRQTEYSWLILSMFLMVCGIIVFELFSTSYYLAQLWFPIGLALTTVKLCGFKYVKK